MRPPSEKSGSSWNQMQLVYRICLSKEFGSEEIRHRPTLSQTNWTSHASERRNSKYQELAGIRSAEEKRKENKDEAAVLPCTAALRWEEIMYLALGLLWAFVLMISKKMDTKNTKKHNVHNVVHFVILCELCGLFILYGFSESPETSTAQIIL